MSKSEQLKGIVPADFNKHHLRSSGVFGVASTTLTEGRVPALERYPTEVEHLLFCDPCTNNLLVVERALSYLHASRGVDPRSDAAAAFAKSVFTQFTRRERVRRYRGGYVKDIG